MLMRRKLAMTKKIITDYKDLQFNSLGEGSQVEVAVL
jgi:hypothetical protein